ncbi:hypothetical protein DYB28_011905 [Aphanomyces astaci]|uniref:Uncharacterized protein n=1 Tax=Aphanomyces astaci TaxID=112090 RepID=A0A397F9V2_APHAT|nr:hypothetical protein DYB31_015195 [Aphanomyces astaci]RLN99897.1 hypothetical protein DYB28_011905 [Aphanomyces astaci]
MTGRLTISSVAVDASSTQAFRPRNISGPHVVSSVTQLNLTLRLINWFGFTAIRVRQMRHAMGDGPNFDAGCVQRIHDAARDNGHVRTRVQEHIAHADDILQEYAALCLLALRWSRLKSNSAIRRFEDGSMQALTGIANGRDPLHCRALICPRYFWYSRIKARLSALVEPEKVGDRRVPNLRRRTAVTAIAALVRIVTDVRRVVVGWQWH